MAKNIYPKQKTARSSVVDCPTCVMFFHTEQEMVNHFVREHEELTEKIIKVFDNVEDFGYFISQIKSKLNNLKTERWYNS